MTTDSARYLSTLHQQINQYFNLDEVHELCFELGVDNENIPGKTRSAFIRHLLVSLARQNRLPQLIAKLRRERPFVPWEEMPTEFELPTNVADENLQQVVNYHVYSGDVVQQDKVVRDKVAGNKTSVGDIDNATGLAIGGGANAPVNPDPMPPKRPFGKPTMPKAGTLTVQQTVDRINIYLQLVPDDQQAAVTELTDSLTLIIQVAAQQPADALQLKLLCLGMQQLAHDLNKQAAGLDRAVDEFLTAVQQD